MYKWLAILAISVICWGCPYESAVPLEKHPVEKIDSSMLGYWYGIIKDGSDYFGIEALDITAKTDSTYSIIRYGKAAKGDIILPDTSYFTGYTSYIGSQRFMNIEGEVVIVETRKNKPPAIVTQKVFYIANFNLHQDTLSMRTITENFSANRNGFKTSEELKNTVSRMLTGPVTIYDDLYTLSYRKIERPKPLKAF